ncbi:MAG: AMP-binding protein [Lautropia sp.]
MEQLKELVIGGSDEASRSLADDVARCVSGLLAEGCKAGDRIAVLMRNCREQLVVTLAAQHLGAYPVQMNWHSQAPELHYVLADCGACLLAAHTDLLTILDARQIAQLSVISVAPNAELADAYRIPPEKQQVKRDSREWQQWLAPHEPSRTPPSPAVESIIYTSGTTGNPKGVRRFASTPQQVLLTEKTRRQMTGIDAGARVMVPAPLYHTAPHMFALRAVRKAEALVVPARFDAVKFLRDIERYRITHVYAVPTIFVRLLALPERERKRYDLSSLQFALHAGGPCAPAIKRAMIDWWGPVINEYYGSTEAGPSTFCTSVDALEHPGTIGRPLEGVRIEVHDDDGRPLPAGEVGELLVRNDGYADFTYLNRDADRAALQRGGLMATGDMGYFDAEGYYFLCDRKRDLVISGGANIYPAEIEAATLELPQAADCVVFGIPDEEFGEALAALVELHPGQNLEAEQVKAHLKKRLAAFKVPRLVEIRDRLPRDESGKIRKRLLREPFWKDAGRRI